MQVHSDLNDVFYIALDRIFEILEIFVDGITILVEN